MKYDHKLVITLDMIAYSGQVPSIQINSDKLNFEFDCVINELCDKNGKKQ